MIRTIKNRATQAQVWGSKAAIAVLALGLVACGEDAEKSDAKPTTEGTAFAVMVNVAAPDADVSYLTTIASLDAGHVLDLDDAIEFPGVASILGLSGQPSVWVTSWDEPTIERWDFNAQGVFERGAKVSFANLGALNTGYVSESRAFSLERAAFYSAEAGAVILWNPTTMELIDSLPLELPNNGEIPPADGWLQLRPDGSLLVDYYYLDGDWNLGDRVGLKTVDWDKTEVVGSDEWVGCNYLGRGSQTSDGTTYYSALAQWVQDSVLWPGEPTTAVPCLLRVLPGETTFDRDFQPNDLGELIGGKQVTGSLEILNDERAYFVAWHEELLSEELTPDNYDDLRYSAPAWKWYTWDLHSGTATEVESEPFASQPDVLWADGRMLFRDQRLTADDAGRGITPIYELTAEGTLEKAFTAYGNVSSIVKVRN